MVLARVQEYETLPAEGICRSSSWVRAWSAVATWTHAASVKVAGLVEAT